MASPTVSAARAETLLLPSPPTPRRDRDRTLHHSGLHRVAIGAFIELVRGCCWARGRVKPRFNKEDDNGGNSTWYGDSFDS